MVPIKLERPAKKNIYLLPAFLIPAAILVFTFTLLGIYPFGTHNIINHDLYHQYLPIMEEFQRVLHGEGSLFYSFKGGLGTNFYALSTYQNASPITWLFLLLFKESQLVLCVTLMIMLKICLASCTMYYYLSYMNPSDAGDGTGLFAGRNVLNLALGNIYALCGYVIAYYYNVMWLDTVILLPIVVLGMRRAMAGEGTKLYVIALALMLITSYYTGLMVCIFLFMYFFVHYIADYNAEKNNRGFVRTFVHIGVLSVLSIAISMVVLLPSFLALTKTSNYSTLGDGFSHFLYYSIPSHFARLLPGSSATTITGPANIYAGLATLILLFLFIFNKKIPGKSRAIKGGFVLFLFASTNIIPFDLVWHFFHIPNGIPARYSFLLAFMLVDVAADSLDHLDALNRKSYIAAFLCILALYAIALLGGGEEGRDIRFMLLFGIALVILYAFVFFVATESNMKLAASLIAIVMILEVSFGAFHGIGSGGIVESNRYHYHKSEVTKLIKLAEDKDPFARLEIIGTDNYNAPYIYGYKGASIFASSVPVSNYASLNSLLKNKYDSVNTFVYDSVNTSRDALLNIRYYISLDEELETPGIKLVSQLGDCYLYENTEPYSLGFMLSEGTKSLAALTHSDLISKLDVEEMTGRSLTGTITADTPGDFMITIPYDDGWQISAGGRNITKYRARNGLITFPLEQGTHKIEMKYSTPGFTAGLIITVTGIILYVACELLRRRKTTR